MADNTMVTRSKGGTAEKTQPVNQIAVPDLWHIAQAIKHGRPMPFGKPGQEAAATMILDTWQLAHDLKRHIIATPAPANEPGGCGEA